MFLFSVILMKQKLLFLPPVLTMLLCTLYLVYLSTPADKFLGRTVDVAAGVFTNVQTLITAENVYGAMDVTGSVLDTADMLIGVYFNGEYAFAVSRTTAKQLAEYLNQDSTAVVAQNSASCARFSKDIAFLTVDALDGKYAISFDDAVEFMNRAEIVYRTLTVTPKDTLQSLAEKVGVSEEILGTYSASYNNTALPNDWAEHTLIPGTQIAYPVTTQYLSLYYVREVSELVSKELDAKVIYDDTMYEDELVVDSEGAVSLECVTTAYIYDIDGNLIDTEVKTCELYAEGTQGVVRVGTKPSRTMADTSSVLKGKYFTPVLPDVSKISAYMGDGRGHKGVDFAAPYATPIYAAASGTVTDASGGWNSGYGNAVVIENDDGNICRYAHMSWYVVNTDDKVEQGQLIGYVGSTGSSTGNHLHFEVICNGIYRNPLNYINY